MRLFLFRRHKTLSALLVLLIVVLIWYSWETWSRRGAEQAAGTYLTNGGASYLVIESRGWNQLEVTSGFIVTIHDGYYWKPEVSAARATFSRDRLRLNQREVSEGKFAWFPRAEGNLHLELTPSTTRPGDWNLVTAHYTCTEYSLYGWTPFFRYWSRRIKQTVIRPEPVLVANSTGPDWSLPSFLHKVKDPRIAEYMGKRLRGEFSHDDLEGFREIYNENRDDPYLQVHAIEVESATGDADVAGKILTDWESRLRSDPDPLLRISFERAHKSYLKATGSPRGQDLQAMFSPIQDESFDLDELFVSLRKLSSYDFLLSTSKSVVEPLLHPDYVSPGSVTDAYLEFPVVTRVLGILSVFDLFLGQGEKSREKMGWLYRFGQNLIADGPLLQRLFGQSVRGQAMSKIRLNLLNACETVKDASAMHLMLERLHQTPGQETGETLYSQDRPPFFSHLSVEVKYFKTEDPEEIRERTVNRHKALDTYFQIYRVAAAAKYLQTKTGEIPSTPAEFSSVLSGGFRTDPFTGKDLCLKERDDQSLTIYTFGPDGADDGGRLKYDPTNGLMSRGDRFLTLKPDREYPFPPEGVRARNAASLLNQFPNGLPNDPYNDHPPQPLSILDSTPESLVQIFSFGPTGDNAYRYTNLTPHTLPGLQPAKLKLKDRKSAPIIGKYQYVFDPIPSVTDTLPYTIVSVTDEVTPIARKTPFFPGVGPMGDLMNAMGAIFAEIGDTPLGDVTGAHFTLGPYYDPTNGTSSPGHLFIEIPRQ